MQMINRILIMSILLLFSLQLSAKPLNKNNADSVEILTEQSAIALALEGNPNLAQMQARYEALKNIPSQVGTLADPILSLGAVSFPTDSFERNQEGMTQLQIGFSQALPFPGKLSLKAEAAEFEAKAAYFDVAEMRLLLAKNISHKWWQMFYLDRAIVTVDKNQALLRQFIEVAETKYTTGKGLQQDVLLAQLELSKLIDKKIQINALRDEQLIRLNILMNIAPRSLITLPEEINLLSRKVLPEQQLYQLANKFRPVLKKHKQLVLAAKSKLDLAEREYFPDFIVGVTYGDRTGQNSPLMAGERADLFSIKLGIKLPLYAGTKQSYKVKQRIGEQFKSKYAYRDEMNQVRADIASSLTKYSRSTEQLSLFTTGILPQARQTVQSMLAGYQVSEVDFLNLVRSQVTLFNYELQYWQAVSQSNQALASLQASIGKESIYE
ncbi:TolC family protein [Colwellia sp. M166]|uniref:TolC family protein n=1 Tax=Colwellia sp. M166 TaxID=2583805 RepID=UPI000C93DB95|nr:TolC family protein [Colwellia sp. M166]MAD77086.1 transporter [Rheinheimera sp.]UUO24359.1 TolC family protein [Colwellia sp. M166]